MVVAENSVNSMVDKKKILTGTKDGVFREKFDLGVLGKVPFLITLKSCH